jgi:hypothetical protein
MMPVEAKGTSRGSRTMTDLPAGRDAIKQRIGGGAPPEVMRVTDPREAATSVIGEEAAARAWKEGEAMTPEEAVGFATGEDGRNDP